MALRNITIVVENPFGVSRGMASAEFDGTALNADQIPLVAHDLQERWGGKTRQLSDKLRNFGATYSGADCRHLEATKDRPFAIFAGRFRRRVCECSTP